MALNRIVKLEETLRKSVSEVNKRIDELMISDKSDELKNKIANESKALRRLTKDLKDSVFENIQNIERTRVFRYIVSRNQYDKNKNVDNKHDVSSSKMYQDYSTIHLDADKMLFSSIRKSLEERRIEKIEQIKINKSNKNKVKAEEKDCKAFVVKKYKPENRFNISVDNQNFTEPKENKKENKFKSPLDIKRSPELQKKTISDNISSMKQKVTKSTIQFLNTNSQTHKLTSKSSKSDILYSPIKNVEKSIEISPNKETKFISAKQSSEKDLKTLSKNEKIDISGWWKGILIRKNNAFEIGFNKEC